MVTLPSEGLLSCLGQFDPSVSASGANNPFHHVKVVSLGELERPLLIIYSAVAKAL
jgi:hypothetical protein